jgi:DNA-binding NtrC family response regulator
MIVLIDDDEIQNLINSKVISLVNPEIEVKAFTSGEEALSSLRNSEINPKLVFLDINMPKMNGWDFLEAYANEKEQAIVYMLTSSINLRDIEKSEKYEIVRSFVSKPLIIDRLRDILAENKLI